MHHIFFININDNRQLLYNNGKIDQKKFFLKSHHEK